MVENIQYQQEAYFTAKFAQELERNHYTTEQNYTNRIVYNHKWIDSTHQKKKHKSLFSHIMMQ